MIDLRGERRARWVRFDGVYRQRYKDRIDRSAKATCLSSLPPDSRVLGVTLSDDSDEVLVLLAHDSFPPIAADDLSLVRDATISYESSTANRFRIAWERDPGFEYAVQREMYDEFPPSRR